MDDKENNRAAAPQGRTGLGVVRTWQQQLAQGVLRTLVILGPLAAAAGSYYDYSRGEMWTIPVYWATYGVLLVITFWKRVPYTVQARTIMALMYGLALLDFPADGRGGSGRLFLLILPFMAGLFFGTRESIVALAIAMLTMIGYGWAFSTGLIVAAQEVDSADPIGWLSNTLVLLMLSGFVVVGHNYLVPRLLAALNQSRGLTQTLEEERSKLESQVSERTTVLERRTRYLEATADIAREASSELDLEALLPRVVGLIADRFEFFRLGILLLDSNEEWAILRAASGGGGQRLVDRGFRVRVESESIVAHVMRSGQPYIAPDVRRDPLYLEAEDVADTRSEMTLPLRARGRVLGALTVQSPQLDAFGDDDVAVMQTLADQVALAISNAQLFQQAQEALEAERRAYGELSLEAWRELVRARPDVAVLRDERGISPLSGWLDPEVEQALETGRSATSGDGARNLAVPIRVRGHVVGVIDAHLPEGSEGWAPEQIALIETITERLANALESARLYQDTQQRAAREELLSTVTARMRETLDLDTVLQTAIREIGDALGIAEVEVRLGPAETNGDGHKGSGEVGP